MPPVHSSGEKHVFVAPQQASPLLPHGFGGSAFSQRAALHTRPSGQLAPSQHGWPSAPQPSGGKMTPSPSSASPSTVASLPSTR